MAKKGKEFEYEYDPIKELKGGEKAKAVVWSTNSLNAAVDGLSKGLPLKANPFIGQNTKLLKPDLVYKRTKEELEDYVKCMEDPVYFASKCYIIQPTGLEKATLRDYQIDYLHHLQQHRFSIMLSCRQAGKSVTTAIYCLWKILFNVDKSGLILSKSGPAGVDLLKKIKDMYLYLPYYLKCGTLKWNQSEISFDNNSSICTESFSDTAGLGKTINFLILDEFAWCPPNDVELFYQNIIPTITTISDSNVCIMSTQNGFNKFYQLWNDAVTGKSIYGAFKVDWWQVPQWNTKTKTWEKRTDEWKNEMIGVLGSEEAFYYQYGTQFSTSDKCLVSREKLSNIRANVDKFINRDDIDIYLTHKEFLYWDKNFDTAEINTGSFILLCDLAEGSGGDYTIFNILQLQENDILKQIGYWRSNSIDIENAALEFWLLTVQLFNNDKCLYSIEWNTYGSLFYNMLLQLNEPEYKKEYSWRFNIIQNNDTTNNIEFDITHLVQYKKGSIDNDTLTKSFKNRSTIPGIRFNSSNKITACSLLKLELEKGTIIISDLITAQELENFEDKTGSGTYKASYGHDDIIMTFCQLPLLKRTYSYKNLLDEIELQKQIKSSEQNSFMIQDDFYGNYGNYNYNQNDFYGDYVNYNYNYNQNDFYGNYNYNYNQNDNNLNIEHDKNLKLIL